MKILAINSSHRGRSGLTQLILERLLQGASDEGAICETVFLNELTINICKACEHCHKQDTLFQCVYNDDFNLVIDKIKSADIVVYATPIYVFTMSSLLKIFLERLYGTSNISDFKITRSRLFFHHVNKEISSQPFVLLSCCNNLEKLTSKSLLSYFKIYAKFSDAKMVGTLIRRSINLMQGVKNEKILKNFPKVRTVYDSFYKAGQELALFGEISRKTQKMAEQHLINVPFLDFLMKIKFFKYKMVQKAKEMFELNFG